MTPAVILAAGAATRFGEPKQRLLLRAVLERLSRSPVGQIVVVEGAHSLGNLVPAGVELVRCEDWARGPGASLRRGLEAFAGERAGALVVLADGPNLDPRAVARVLARHTEARVVAASYGGVRGHPVHVAVDAWAGIPDEGLRSLPALLVSCDDLEPPGDIDYALDIGSPTSLAFSSSEIGSDTATRT